jgi:TonB family protein
VELTAAVAAAGGRVLAGCGAAATKSELQRRVEQIFSSSVRRSSNRWVRACLAAVFCPALYVAGAMQVQPPANQQTPNPESSDQALLAITTPDQANAAEADLERNPEDMKERNGLMAYYMKNADESQFVRHLTWMIEHHPENVMTVIQPRNLQNREQVRAAWEQALASHPNDPEVYRHAGIFFSSVEPERALSLYRQAASMMPADSPQRSMCVGAMTGIYLNAVLFNPGKFRSSVPMDESLAATLRNELDSSTDPELLSSVGTRLVRFGRQETGIGYIEKAIALDPANPKWKQELEWAKTPPEKRASMAEGNTPPGTVRLAAQIAEANLVKKVDPVYPPLAVQARVQGSVEFSIVIGRDGHIQSIQLVRGHPLLVNAAKEALLEWEYKPTLLNGKPVPVSTIVYIPFQLPQ